MKKIIFSALLLTLTTITFSQQNEPAKYGVNETLLQKSKKQKTAAWILIGSGAVLMTTAALIPQGEYTSSGNIWEDLWGGGSYENEGVRSAFGVTGFLTMLGSIPLFVAAGKNSKKAMSLSFKNESSTIVQNGSWVKQPVPSISLKLNL